jgi:quinol monooxygenase YgiN
MREGENANFFARSHHQASEAQKPSARQARLDCTGRHLQLRMRRFRIRQLCTIEQELGLRRNAYKKALRKPQPTKPPPTAPEGPIARMSEVALRQGSTPEALSAAYQQDVQPVLASAGGWRGAVMLVDRAAHRARSLTLWDSSAAMDAAAQEPGYREAMKGVAEHFAGPPESATYELGALLLPRAPRELDE